MWENCHDYNLEIEEYFKKERYNEEMKLVNLVGNLKGEITEAILKARHPKYMGYGMPSSLVAFTDMLDFWFKGEEKTPPPIDVTKADKRWQDTVAQHSGEDALVTFVVPARNSDGTFKSVHWTQLRDTGFLGGSGSANFYRIYENHPSFKNGVPTLTTITMTNKDAMTVNFNSGGSFVDYPIASWVGPGGWHLGDRGLMFDKATGLPVLFDLAEFQKENPRDMWVNQPGSVSSYTPDQAVGLITAILVSPLTNAEKVQKIKKIVG